MQNKSFKISDQKCLIWAYLGCNFEKTVILLEIDTLEFVETHIFIQKNLNLGPN